MTEFLICLGVVLFFVWGGISFALSKDDGDDFMN